MPFSPTFFLPTQLWLGIAPLLRRVARGRFGRVLRILVDPLLQFFHLLFQRLVISPKQDDHRLHRGWASFPNLLPILAIQEANSLFQFTSCLAVSLLLTITLFQTLWYLSKSVFTQLNGYIYCKNCQEYFAFDLHFCPNCGNKADKRKDR